MGVATIRVNEAELHYEDEGTGDPIVFIHGVWMTSTFLAAFVSPAEDAADLRQIMSRELLALVYSTDSFVVTDLCGAALRSKPW